MISSLGVKKLAIPGVSVMVGAASAAGMPSGNGPADITNTSTHITPYCRKVLASRIPREGGQQATRHPSTPNPPLSTRGCDDPASGPRGDANSAPQPLRTPQRWV